jgi:hypothetical protein
MMAQWNDVYQSVAQWLKTKSQDGQLTQLWRGVFTELHERWSKRKDIVAGEVGKEITIKINVASAEIADKAMKRIAEFVKEFGNHETDNVTVKMLAQKYKRGEDLAVLIRLRIVSKSENSRSKFEVDDVSQI